MEIRSVIGKLDAWEIVSPRRCCIFDWERGVVYVDEQRHCPGCIRELIPYAVGRGYHVVYQLPRVRQAAS